MVGFLLACPDMAEDEVAADPLIGTKIADLIVGEPVGLGGTATVYRAERTAPMLVVRALKVMDRETTKKLKLKDRFREEARLLEKLDHKNIVKFYDAREERGRLVMVLEFLEGKTLRAYIEQWQAEKTTPPLDFVLEVLCQASEGVAFAHGFDENEGSGEAEPTARQVVVHRDLKPDNLFVTKKQITKVLDFGIAKALDDADRATQTTNTSVAMATAKYLAPEMWEGIESPTPAADVYSLGITLFEALAGRHPFDEPDKPVKKNTTGYFTAHQKHERPRLRDVRPDAPESLDEIVNKAIARDPHVRYPSAKEFGEALRATQRELALPKRRGVLPKNDAATKEVDPRRVRSKVPLPVPPKMQSLPPGASKPGQDVQPATPSPNPTARHDSNAAALEAPRAGLSRTTALVGIVVSFVIGVVIAAVVWPKKSSEDSRTAQPTGSAIFASMANSAAPSASAMASSSSSAASSSGPCPDGMQFIPAGTFKMGSDTGEADERGDEPTRVEAFCMDTTEVTVAAYQACVKTKGCVEAPTTTVQWPVAGTTLWSQFCNANRAGRENHPINCVDWAMANGYCEKNGKRLPTEREWEYAARGTDGRTYPWDPKLGEPRKGLLNGCGPECVALLKSKGQPAWTTLLYVEDDGFPDTAPVGSYPEGKSPFGLLDMAGNVWEWTSSFYKTNYKSKTEDTRSRMIRGGSWLNSEAPGVSTSKRGTNAPTDRSSYVGFRCAKAMP